MDYLPKIENALTMLSSYWPDVIVSDAAKYSLLNPGKRIRPILAIEAFKVVGGNGDMIIPYACALEMIHTSSLLVDDLMDNHKERRGKPTCWVQYGIGMAVLASHLISSEAFKLFSQDDRCLNEITNTVIEMCIGQANEDSSLKTGSLIRTSVLVGGFIGEATKEQLQALLEYGDKIGPAFQLRDDMLDNERPYEELKLDLSCLDIFGSKAEELRTIAKFIVERTQ